MKQAYNHATMSFVGTHCDKAVRFDLVNPEAFFHHCARSVQQLFELAQSERSNLWTPGGRAVQLTEEELDLSILCYSMCLTLI